MRISSLELQNFMGYRSRHFIDFSVDESAPVILFLGENGHGKSTIQHAAKWCLYGIAEEKGQEIPRSALANRKAVAEEDDPPVSVTLTWTAGGKSYELRREMILWGDKSPGMSVQLRIDGGNPEPTAAIPEYVQRFLAKEISHFVFFNGEVQQEFDDMATNSGSAEFVRREIEKTLSIPVIIECVNWLRSRATEESAAIFRANKSNEKVAAAQKKRMEAQEVADKLKEEYNTSVHRRAAARNQREAIEAKMSDLQAIQELASELAVLRSKKKELRITEAGRRDAVRDYLSSNPWLPLAPSLLKRKHDLEAQVAEASASITAIAKLRLELGLLESLRDSDQCPLCHSIHEVTSDEVVNRIERLTSSIDSIGELDTLELERSLYLLKQVGVDEGVYAGARSAQKLLNSASAELAKCEQRLAEREEDLNLYGDLDVQDLLTSYRGYVAAEKEAQAAIDDYRRRIEDKEREVRKYENEVGKAKGVSPQQRKTLAAYEYLEKVFDEAQTVYTREVKEQVQTYASETFIEMISDPKYVGLRINDNFGVDLMMKDGEPDPLRSTGQGKIATISLVSGLIKTAMSDGSILMDTPFVSLDEGHRREVARWAYSSGLSVSLFMHSGEFKKDEHLGFFDGHVGRIYRIRQVDTNESTIEAL